MTDIRQMPKAELHCHLDGSISPVTAQRLLRRMGREYELDRLTELMQVPASCTSLAEYLSRFTIPVSCIQDEYGLTETAYDLAKRVSGDNVKYLEVRFAPILSLPGGMKVEEIIESVEKGLSKARTETGIYTGIIVCAMRHMSFEENAAMLKAARELYGSGVVACDLAGDEAAFPIDGFAELLALARRLELPFTIHSGETGNADNIRGAIEFGAKRIGHGIAMSGNAELMRLCANRRIGIEMCPTSNLQTRAIDRIENYPIIEFLNNGVCATVNTDNMTASNTTDTKELELMRDTFGFDYEVFRKLYANAVEVAFTDDNTKDRLLREW